MRSSIHAWFRPQTPLYYYCGFLCAHEQCITMETTLCAENSEKEEIAFRAY